VRDCSAHGLARETRSDIEKIRKVERDGTGCRAAQRTQHPTAAPPPMRVASVAPQLRCRRAMVERAASRCHRTAALPQVGAQSGRSHCRSLRPAAAADGPSAARSASIIGPIRIDLPHVAALPPPSPARLVSRRLVVVRQRSPSALLSSRRTDGGRRTQSERRGGTRLQTIAAALRCAV
jgi:hypothetical protein